MLSRVVLEITGMPLDKLNLKNAYTTYVSGVGGSKRLQQSIGAQFESYGIVEREMLRFYGLEPGHFLVDVGCGSGRLAIPLSEIHSGSYLGTDVVPELLEHAAANVRQPHWQFRAVEKLEIPADDRSADMVCMFSVLTHLLHEQSFLYLREAGRALKPDGVVVFSFLEFAMPFHWSVFEQTVADEAGDRRHPLNVFIERVAIERWAQQLGFRIMEFRNGNDPFVPLSFPLTLDGGQVLEKFGNLGQSICVLRKQASLDSLS